MDLIDKRDEVLRLFLEYGITENTENDLTKTDLAECAEKIVEKLFITDVVASVLCVDNEWFSYHLTRGKKYKIIKENETHYKIKTDSGLKISFKKERFKKL